MKAKLKAWIFTIFFSIIGCVMVYKNFNLVKSPMLLFYIILIVDSYFSVGFFSKIVPSKRVDQKIIDFLLVCFYLILILNINNEIWYLLSAIMLFAVATLKYIFLLGVVDFRVLKRKLMIDILGMIVCVLALVGYLIGLEMMAMWIWSLIFLLANIYLLIIKPVYKE